MDKLERYRSCIQTLLEKHSQFKSRNEDVENELFFDPVRDRLRRSKVYRTPLVSDRCQFVPKIMIRFGRAAPMVFLEI